MIEVIVASIRPTDVHRLIWSLEEQTMRPDMVTVVSNEIMRLDTVLNARIIRFTSHMYPFGRLDVALRRNIGIWAAEADTLVFQDDDQVAPRTMVENVSRLMEDRLFVFGHHRYIDFDSVDRETLMDGDPTLGVSRESPPNSEHSFLSGYAGMFAANRNLLIAIGGFDLMFLGRHGNEDQNLARRLSGERIFVHEPPFAWHPTNGTSWAITGPTNLCGSHQPVDVVINGVAFKVCGRCPYWTFADTPEKLYLDEPVIPFDPGLVVINKEVF